MTIKWLKSPLSAALLLVLLWTVYRLVCLRYTGIPQPVEHDEFSYLLGADTFAHGRLANPPLTLGKFFESPHILVRPVYASKYPPGQALFLALGQVLFGSAFYGVLIGNAFMLFTFCLMLFAWVPARSALLVSAMFGLTLSRTMYWTNSYWGGSVAASGGALVLLGIGIYRSKQSALGGFLFAVGIMLLFWTRPYEGGIFTLVVLIVLAKELWRKPRTRVLVISISAFTIGMAWTCYYNQVITGSPFRLPYFLYDRQYNVTPVFWFQPLRPQPTYSQPRLGAQHGTNGWESSQYHKLGPWYQSVQISLIRSLSSMVLTLGPALLLILVVPVARRDPLYRKMAIVNAVFLLALTAETFHTQHYAAPAWAALGLMIAVWAERAWTLRIGNLQVGVALVLLAIVSPAIVVSSMSETLDMNSWGKWSERRAALIETLSRKNRGQLVIVQYPSSDWRVEKEWVYNGADIDHQRVVFAHDLGMEQNRALLDYYPDRTALLLTFDSASGQEKIEPYPALPLQR